MPHDDRVDPVRAVRTGLFTTAQALAAGHRRPDVRRRLATGEWVRVERGVLARADRTATPADAALLAVLRAGPSAVVSHATAARLRGWDLPLVADGVHVTVPAGRSRTRAAPGVTVHHAACECELFEGVLPVTTACRTALDLAACLDPDDAVVALDSALRAERLSPDELGAELRSRRSWPGGARAATALALASPRAGSVPETRARLLIHHARLPAPVDQLEIRCAGRFVARVDLGWPVERVVLEVDGYEFHSSREAFARDRRRQNELVLAGWTVLRVAPADLAERPDEVLRQLREALGCV